MEHLSIEVDASEAQSPPIIEQLSSSGFATNNAAYEIQDIGSDGDHEKPQDIDNIITHSVGRTRRGRTSMSPSDDDDFKPPVSSTRVMSRPRSSSRGRTVIAGTRSKSQSRQQSTTNKPKKTRSRSRKSSTSRQAKASIKPAKSRSRSRSASKGRKPATRGRRGRM